MTRTDLSWQERALTAERDNETLRTALTWCRDTLRTVTSSIEDLHDQLPKDN